MVGHQFGLVFQLASSQKHGKIFAFRFGPMDFWIFSGGASDGDGDDLARLRDVLVRSMDKARVSELMCYWVCYLVYYYFSLLM